MDYLDRWHVQEYVVSVEEMDRWPEGRLQKKSKDMIMIMMWMKSDRGANGANKKKDEVFGRELSSFFISRGSKCAQKQKIAFTPPRCDKETKKRKEKKRVCSTDTRLGKPFFLVLLVEPSPCLCDRVRTNATMAISRPPCLPIECVNMAACCPF